MRLNTLLLLTTLPLATLSAAFLPGYDKWRFYMSPDEVKGTAATNGYAAGDLVETQLELVQFPYVSQDFTVYDLGRRMFMPLQFISNVPAMMKATEGSVKHLSVLEAKHFKQITIPANRTANPPRDWELKFVFYASPLPRKAGPTNLVHQLIAIVSTFKGTALSGEFAYLPRNAMDWVEKELRTQYGVPNTTEMREHDRQVVLFKETWLNQTTGLGLLPFKHNYQICSTWVSMGGRMANLQITRMADEWASDFLLSLRTGDYDVPENEWKNHLRVAAPAEPK